MEIVKNWKLHLFAAVVIAISELIGVQRIGIIVLMPILYATVIGGLISLPKFKLLSVKDMDDASEIFPIALSLLLAKIGLGVGPNLPMLLDSGGTLFLQLIGHFAGTIAFALPVALLLGLGRETIGATYSLGREVHVSIIADKYGLSSAEGRGVMAIFICGTVFGALWTGVLSSVVAGMDIFHPFALALGAGTGSISMSAAAMGSIMAYYPEHSEAIEAYAGASNILANVIGLYAAMFVTLPLARVCYDLLDKFRSKTPEDVDQEKPEIADQEG